MTDPYDVEVNGYAGLDFEKAAREALEEVAIKTQNEWIENLERGEGANGNHGSPYVNTGEAVNDITVEWLDALTVVVGGDVVQLAVAEDGRVPTPGSPPPYEPIADWAREKGLEPDDGQSFEDMVDAIRFSIADQGLEGFAPGQAAVNAVAGELEDRTRRKVEQQMDEATDGE